MLDKTPFYGESGGQVGDTGEIVGAGFRFEVIDTQKEGDFMLHLGHLRSERIEQGATVTARVDADAPPGNPPGPLGHAHPALRPAKAPGQACPAAGLEGRADWLRFDFTNPGAVGRDELAAIEAEVNELVASQRPRSARAALPIAEAREAGAMMLFGEKYPDIVRMVSMGDVQQGAVRRHASGQHRPGRPVQDRRRGERVGRHAADHRPDRLAALEYVREHERALAELAALLRVPAGEVPGAWRRW